MKAVEFWFEFASTYSYPAAMRIESMALECGVTLIWRPFLLGPIFSAQGWKDSPFNIYPAKGRYMWRDLERICDAQGLPLCHPSSFPRNAVLAARVAVRFAEAPWLPSFVRAVYSANFADDKDISLSETVSSCLTSVGQNAASILKESQSPEAKDLLRRQIETAASLGIFGAPSFVVGDELFWGNDRLAQALEWASERTTA
ncbi:MAG TPA: 2-hydroxychromene-2-carboxylate isomerase [Gammaproteobacteria bacterium]|jgi:2-hydroxychromene-2-carboxylate isomerase|nr:2-hydroxychromene-2-carboxylate isomerase [Gammaproteobacteria bacterium]